ncbi:unnamed protein product [Acanthoscelides obtectus]|uniref:Uncharacterized protein n=1 Tax=Acanthoscelides obtectus TaxID=200917 RepID=A0A9P0LTM9_ACAOB|nr:unnamed protein product [Acanthoscelides obtectus]CAK1651363.1 hypothetical protein AOBTE_LOCUS17222 [Acanthoscelides obtectus]
MGKWSCSMKLNSSLLCTIIAENSTTNYTKTVGINCRIKVQKLTTKLFS